MRVTFTPLGRSAQAHSDETILDVARRAGAPLGNSCGGVGVCARCLVRVVEGDDHLSPPTTIELRVGAQRGFTPPQRLACQAIVLGDIDVTAGYW